MRLIYGRSADDWTHSHFDITDFLQVLPERDLTMWDSPEGGEQIEDLLNTDGGATSIITSDQFGFIPIFFGPDDPEVEHLWVEYDGADDRVLLSPRAAVFELDEQVTSLETNLSSAGNLTELDNNLNNLNSRLDNVDSALGGLNGQLDSISDTMDSYENDLYPGCPVFYGTRLTSMALTDGNADNLVAFENVIVNRNGVWSAGTPNTVTVPAGQYEVWGHGSFGGAMTGATRTVQILWNGTQAATRGAEAVGVASMTGAGFTQMSGPVVITAEENDTIQLSFRVPGTAAGNTTHNVLSYMPAMYIEYIGPLPE